MVERGMPRRRIPENILGSMPKFENDEINWDKVGEILRSSDGLSQKHLAVDRLLKELHDKEQKMNAYKDGLKERFEQEKSQYVLDLEAKLSKLNQEKQHLEEILKLRSSDL